MLEISHLAFGLDLTKAKALLGSTNRRALSLSLSLSLSVLLAPNKIYLSYIDLAKSHSVFILFFLRPLSLSLSLSLSLIVCVCVCVCVCV